MIPLVDLAAQYRRLRPELLAALEGVAGSSSYIQGKRVGEFEASFAVAHGAAHAVGCSSGTSAIFLALKALGVGSGDEVITTPNSFIATAEAICHAGAKPVFVDIDPETYNLDPSRIENAITKRSRAIIPVHVYGNPCAMDPIMDVARATRLGVVEDCAQAHLARYRGKSVGTFGEAATFSFYPSKNLGAFGDAGLVFTSTPELAESVKRLLDHGRTSKYEHGIVGYNHRMDEIQAAVLLVKLRYLAEWTSVRRERARLYDHLLAQGGYRVAKPTPGAEPVHHLYVVEVENREETLDFLKANGIGAGIHYPTPLHLQPALAELGHRRGDFPVAERAAARLVSLPICAELTEASARKVVSVFGEVARA